MSLVPGLKHDCFISYRRLDDQGLDGVQGHGWVSTFYKAFCVSLQQRLGEPADVFMDAQLEGNAELPPEIGERARASAVLVPIVSPGYKLSRWCPIEFAAFREKAEADQRWFVGNLRPVMKAVIQPLKDDEHQVLPVDDVGYVFFETDQDTKVPHTLNLGSVVYGKMLGKMAKETAELLVSLKDRKTQVPSAPRPLTSPAKPKEVLLAFDVFGFEEAGAVKLVSCVVLDQPEELAKRWERFKSDVALEPTFSGHKDLLARIRRVGFRYENDEAPLRERVAQELSDLPWDGYVSCADAKFWDEKPEADTIIALVRGVLFDRMRGLPKTAVRLALSPRLAPFWQSISTAATAYRDEIRALDAVTVVGVSSVDRGLPKNAAVEVANYLGSITAARLAAPHDETAKRLFAWLHPNKLRVVHDLRTGTRYSRHKPLPDDFRLAPP